MQDYLMLMEDEILSGTAKTMTDTSHSSGAGKDAIVGGQIMMHGSHSFTVTTTNTMEIFFNHLLEPLL